MTTSTPLLDPNDPVSIEAAAQAAHQRITHAVRSFRRRRHTLAFELLAFHESGFPAVLGFGTLETYAAQVHDLAQRTVRALVGLARQLRGLPKLDAAIASGRLGWTKGRTIAPVLSADSEGAWVEAASAHSVRNLEKMVAHATPGDAPPDPTTLRRPETTRLVFEMPAVEAEKVRDLIAREQAKAPGDERSTGEVLAELLRRVAHDAAPASTERYQVVLERCPSCQQTAGVRAEVEDALVEEARCDADVVDLTEGGDRYGRLSRAIPPRVKRTVLHAHRGECAVPSCDSRLWVDLHHVVPVSAGGTAEAGNLLPLCPAHHRLLHRGRMGLTSEEGCWVFRFDWAPTQRLPEGSVGRSGPRGPRTLKEPDG